MAGEGERSALIRLISVPGLVAVAIVGAAVAAVTQLFGPRNILREVVTEVIASLGSTILVLAVFGLLFRTGLERLLRGSPGGDALARSVERLEVLLQGPGAQDLGTQDPDLGAKLDRIAEDVRSLTGEEVPALREEVAQMRELLADKRND